MLQIQKEINLCNGNAMFILKQKHIRCLHTCSTNDIMSVIKADKIHDNYFFFFQWQKLEMSTVERRKIMCSVTFHIIAITCVIWSLYVLIERTTEEIKAGILEWPFWTKLIVVAIGFTGGLVFMYVQCKMYVQLCRRWRAYNRVIFIQNCPSKFNKIPLNSHTVREDKLDSLTTVQETELL